VIRTSQIQDVGDDEGIRLIQCTLPDQKWEVYREAREGRQHKDSSMLPQTLCSACQRQRNYNQYTTTYLDDNAPAGVRRSPPPVMNKCCLDCARPCCGCDFTVPVVASSSIPTTNNPSKAAVVVGGSNFKMGVRQTSPVLFDQNIPQMPGLTSRIRL